MDELKPCPFCGGEAQLMEAKIGSNWWTVICKHYEDCPVNPVGRNAYAAEIDAIDAWNTRAERTCSGALDFDGWFICESCGCQTKGDQYSELPHYCSNCGAKVVGK